MKKTYEYTVGQFKTDTREAARLIQRSLRSDLANSLGVKAPRIVQKLTVERVVR